MMDSPPSAPVEDMTFVVELPMNDASGGFAFEGSPPRVSAVLAAFPLQGHNVVGCYATAVQLPDVEIAGFTDAQTLQKVLQLYQHISHRRLVLSTCAPISETHNQGLLYSHNLPKDSDLGITFDSFPPRVTAVNTLSPLHGRIVAGQCVDSVAVPGCVIFNFSCGGFTGHRVTQYLRETAGISGRQIVIKDYPTLPDPHARYTKHKQRDPFDLGGFFGNWFTRQRTKPSKNNF